MPRISVIVPIYNAETTLRRCITSILNQSFNDFELLLVDDGSKDHSWDICKEFADDGRIKLIHQNNAGVSAARNAALDIASGDWIAFCDSDDFVDSEWLMDFINVEGENDLIFQSIRYLRNGKAWDKSSLDAKGSTLLDLQKHISQLIRMGVFGYLTNKVFRRSIIEGNGLRFDLKSRFREDEQFLSEYLTYVTYWRSVPSVNYNYFLPNEKKIYGGDIDYSLTRIFQNLDRIFTSGYTSEIADVHTTNIKNLIVNKICRKEVPSEYDIDLYSRLSSKSTQKQSKLLTLLIATSTHSRISRYIIHLIHSIKSYNK